MEAVSTACNDMICNDKSANTKFFELDIVKYDKLKDKDYSPGNDDNTQTPTYVETPSPRDRHPRELVETALRGETTRQERIVKNIVESTVKNVFKSSGAAEGQEPDRLEDPQVRGYQGAGEGLQGKKRDHHHQRKEGGAT